MLEINHRDFLLTHDSQILIICIQMGHNYISSVWSNCINRVRVVQCVILTIKSENQALFLQGMHNFCIIFFVFGCWITITHKTTVQIKGIV